ncbi:MAG: type II secretion system secretin GspD [Vibrio sp.]
MKKWIKKVSLICAIGLASAGAMANEFSASFKGTDIQEFINIVGRNLNKTIIIDPSVRGKIDVRSYDVLNDEQYYKFFLNVLEVYGFAVVEAENGVIKVIKSKDAKTSAVPVVGDNSNVTGDAVITRVVTVKNVSVRELSPILRQLNDNAGAGNVVHYDPANIILITGRASVVNRLAEVIKRVDQAGNKDVSVVSLNNASAAEMVRIVDALNKSADEKNTPDILKPKLVADERTNSVLISGEPQVRARLKQVIRQLDVEMATKGNNRVIYLKNAKAEDMVDVLKGVSDKIQENKGGEGTTSSASNNQVMISADPGTNALVITAPPDVMNSLEDVIAQLDIRRAQVLIEALIVELSEADGINLGVQWANLENGSVVQYPNSGVSIGQVVVGLDEAEDFTETTAVYDTDGNFLRNESTTTQGDFDTLASALGGVSGAALSVIAGDWTALLTAVSTDSNSNILSAPSITALDNQEASFIVGEEVPVLTGSTAGSNNDNPFQTVDRKEVGIKLKVTPQINEGDSVKMEIEQEVSNVLGANGAVDVRFAKRQLNTSVIVQDGQMIVLGGLIDERAQESVSKVPLLGDIPVLGHLFKSTSTSKEKKNLMVFIKPTILRDGMTADGLTQRKYNYIRAEQIYQDHDGLNLMPNTSSPVIPSLGQDVRQPVELRAFFDQLESSVQIQQ